MEDLLAVFFREFNPSCFLDFKFAEINQTKLTFENLFLELTPSPPWNNSDYAFA